MTAERITAIARARAVVTDPTPYRYSGDHNIHVRQIVVEDFEQRIAAAIRAAEAEVWERCEKACQRVSDELYNSVWRRGTPAHP